MTAPIISIRRLNKRFDRIAAVEDVSLDIQENEFFSLLGPSGCGKTTLLRMIAGLEAPTSGEVLIGGENMASRPANQRPVNMVFQSYAVFPHMSVADNVGYGLRVTGVAASEVKTRVRDALEMVRLETLANRRPDRLSGGQRQRVALARALIKRPRVLLLDEPMAALDAKLREQMQRELSGLQKSVGITFIMVTHDQQEALSLSDRIAVMDEGRLVQLGTPKNLYEQPVTLFVANFIGKINQLPATVISHSEAEVRVEIVGLGDIRLPALESTEAIETLKASNESKLTLAIRPEHIQLSASPPSNKLNEADGSSIAISVRIIDQVFLGDSSQINLETANGLKLVALQRRENAVYELGENQTRSAVTNDSAKLTLYASWHARHCRLLPSGS